MTIRQGRTAVVADLFPGSFAMVMATGILAVAGEQQELGWLVDLLYALTVVSYVALLVLLVLRVVRYPRRLLADVTAHAKGFAFLTVVAGTNVLAAASITIHGWYGFGRVLWWVGGALWVTCLYTTLIAVVIRGDKPGLESGINGSWFLLTVSTESIAVVGALLVAHEGGDLLAFVTFAAFVLGIVLYVIVMTTVFLRWTFLELDPTEADPPAWIAAGAVAITVLAGSNILLAGVASPRLERLGTFVEGMVVLAWATSTFWFPLMIAIGVWRHLVRRMPLRYHPAYWALVFPLGMYSAATYKMRAAIQLAELGWLPQLALGAALLAWLACAAGLTRIGAQAVRRGVRSPA